MAQLTMRVLTTDDVYSFDTSIPDWRGGQTLPPVPPSQACVVLADTLCSCEVYGMKPTYAW